MAKSFFKRFMAFMLAFVVSFNLCIFTASANNGSFEDTTGIAEVTTGATEFEDLSGTETAEDQQGTEYDSLLAEYREQAYEAAAETDRLYGLVEFEEAGIDLFSDELINVIVEFTHLPVNVADAIAAAGGEAPKYDLPPATVFFAGDSREWAISNDRAIFDSSLDSVLSSDGAHSSAGGASVEYSILCDFNVGMNGVAIRLPANKVADLLEISSVFAIYPEPQVEPDEYDAEAVYNPADPNTVSKGWLDFIGVRSMHANGITGEGVTVGIIDTGVDYNHPDLYDAFQTWDSLALVPAEYKDKVLQRNDGKYCYYGIDVFAQTGGVSPGASARRGIYDPMETSFDEWLAAGSPSGTELSTHGTHVSGIIAARGVGSDDTINTVGVAPNAKLIMYKYSGIGSGASGVAFIKSNELAVLDGVDIISNSNGNTSQTGIGYANDLIVNRLIYTYGVVYIKSAGNNGSELHTLSGPIVLLGMNIANGMWEGVTLVDFTSGDKTITTAMYINTTTDFFDQDGIGWYSDFNKDFRNADGTYNFYIMPDKGHLGGSAGTAAGADGIALGTPADWAEPDNVEAVVGKIVIVTRGHTFVDVAKSARLAGAAGILFINSATGTSLNSQNSLDDAYLPFFTVSSRAEGLSFVTALKFNDMKGKIADVTSSRQINGGSSRGPVSGTYDIKPDVISTGTNILSTIPYWGSWGTDVTSKPADWQDYAKYGYGSKSGTSMACPSVSGIAALILGEKLKTDGRTIEKGGMYKIAEPSEIIARITNTANMNGMDPSVPYSVHEAGSGRVNPLAALNTTWYVTVQRDDIKMRAEETDPAYNSTNYILVNGDLPSFSFGRVFSGAGMNKTLNATIHNDSDEQKTYTIRYEFNIAGQGVKSPGSTAYLSLSTDSVTVPANSTGEFSATLIIAAGWGSFDIGQYEGYIYLECEGESHRLAFSGSLAPAQALLNVFMLNKPVATNASNEGRQNMYSSYMLPVYNFKNLYINPDLPSNDDNRVWTLSFPFASAETPDVRFDVKACNDLNVSATTSTGGTWSTETNLFNQDCELLRGVNSGKYPEGEYIIYVQVKDKAGVVHEENPIRVYIDNTAPVINITTKDAESKIISGTVSDAGMDYLIANGIKYGRFDLTSTQGRLPSYATDLAIVAVFGSVYTRATVSSSGAFTVNLNGNWYNLADGTSASKPMIFGSDAVSLYVIDHFFERRNDSVVNSAANRTNGFNTGSGAPYFSFARVEGTTNFASIGVNKLVETVIMEGAPGPFTVTGINPLGGIYSPFCTIQVTFNRPIGTEGTAWLSWDDGQNWIAQSQGTIEGNVYTFDCMRLNGGMTYTLQIRSFADENGEVMVDTSHSFTVEGRTYIREVRLEKHVAPNNGAASKQSVYSCVTGMYFNLENVLVNPGKADTPNNRVARIEFYFAPIDNPNNLYPEKFRADYNLSTLSPNSSATSYYGFNAFTTETSEITNIANLDKYPEGEYVILMRIYSGANDMLQVLSTNFYIDNTPPEMNVSEVDTASKTIKGNVSDAGMQYMIEHGIKYNNMDYNNLPDYSKHLLVVAVFGNAYAKATVQANGDFSIGLDNVQWYLLADGTATATPEINAGDTVDFHVLDHAVERRNMSSNLWTGSAWTAVTTAGFPTGTGTPYFFRRVNGSTYYATIGVNRLVTQVTLPSAFELDSVSGTNGAFTALFSGTPDQAPELAGFTLEYSINGGDVKALDITGFEYDGGTGCDFTFEPFAKTTEDQFVVVYVSFDGVTVQYDFTVDAAIDVESASISLSALTTIARGRSIQINHTVTPFNADYTVMWSSSNPNIAKISPTGVLTGVSTGTAVITMTLVTLYGTYTYNVVVRII